ncbi:MAG: hypothetical protein ABI549_06740 [Flavobacterium sp.]|uniref:OB-fold protein n=1 Tax=Flavobacterium sp. TaxID=239 RepID=UPI003263E1B6
MKQTKQLKDYKLINTTVVKNKIKITLFSILIILVIGCLSFNYIMHGGARDVASEKPEFTAVSKKIIAEFTSNINAANKKYLEKTITVQGVAISVNKNEVIIDNLIVCNFTKDEQIKKGQKISIKGRVVGYDDLLEQLNLDQCSINN